MKTIQKGSKGTEVRILQTFLKIEADGIFGKNTQAAVNTWKINNKMEASGVITETDWGIIARSLPTIKKGSKGDAVKMWQLFLGITADGIFGSGTRASTITYQNTANLTADGIVGPKTWTTAFANEILEPAETIVNSKPVDYKQYDSKWAKVVYTKNNTYNKSQTIKSSGCGPTSAADIVATWWDKSITPVELAALSVQKGYRTENSGTAWGFFKFLANKYGASKFVQTSSVATLKEALAHGAYAVVSFGPSKWTKGGHYCCIWKWDGSHFYINDPASAASSRAKGTEKEVTSARKQFFIFYK